MLPINDLAARIGAFRTQIKAATDRVIDSGWLVLGPEVKRFEAAFAAYVGVDHCLGVANGTDAIELGLRATGIAAGDHVATVANAGMYTLTAMSPIGAQPFFMDVALDSQLVTRAEVQRAIAAGVKAIVVTHLFGRVVPDMAGIAEDCRSAGVMLLEDCAQAHGARQQGKQAGSFGDVASFSFYPTKNLGALGDGGAIVTGNVNVARRAALLRQYGWTEKYKVEVEGAGNSRLDEVQAAILSEFLPHLDRMNARRRDIAGLYNHLIKHQGVSLPDVNGEEYVAHLYVLRCTNRDDLRAHLRAKGIASDVHYPIPDHHQPVAGARYFDVTLPYTERLVKEILTLPCYPEMDDKTVALVADAINGWKP